MSAKGKQREMTWKRFFIYLSVLVVMLVVTAVIIDQAVLPSIAGSAETIEVPDVEGMNEDSARIMLSQLGLVVQEPHEQFSKDVPEGAVISQMPYAGARVKEGRRIYLTISEGVETSVMPRVTGMTLREARLTLLRLGLRLGDMAYEFNDSIPKDRVIKQSIEQGTRVKTGTLATLLVSEGPSEILMPDLLGLSLAEAQGILEDYGLSVGFINYIETGTFVPNTVLGHLPPKDSLVPPESEISLSVSK